MRELQEKELETVSGGIFMAVAWLVVQMGIYGLAHQVKHGTIATVPDLVTLGAV